MCEFHRTSRRAFINDLGRGVLAFAIVAPTLVACSGGSETGESSTPTPTSTDPPDSTVGGASQSTVAATAAQSDTTAPTTVQSASDLTEPVTYERISLGFVSAYLLVRGKEAAVVDTGVSGSASAIEGALTAASLDWSAVRHVMLTHHHPDHAGSIADVLTSAVNATAYAGEADLASISAPRDLHAVRDGDEVFGLRIVATPGHTAGHVSIYDPLGQVLIAGDAINNADKLEGPNPNFTADMATAILSAKRLADLPLETIYFGHGSPIETGAGPLLVELALSL